MKNKKIQTEGSITGDQHFLCLRPTDPQTHRKYVHFYLHFLAVTPEESLLCGLCGFLSKVVVPGQAVFHQSIGWFHTARVNSKLSWLPEPMTATHIDLTDVSYSSDVRGQRWPKLNSMWHYTVGLRCHNQKKKGSVFDSLHCSNRAEVNRSWRFSVCDCCSEIVFLGQQGQGAIKTKA